MVLKGLREPSVVVVKLPVRNGTCWPEKYSASSLSSVSTLGVDSRFARVSLNMAVSTAPKEMPSRSSLATAMVGAVKPLATANGFTVAFSLSPMRVSKPPMMPFKVVLTSGTEVPRESPAAISKPRVSTLFTETSTTATSISTCARRTSSWLTMASSSFKVVGSALRMRAFNDSTGCTVAVGGPPSAPD